ncbi:hypothetical protein BegalDRAFT_3177 [Beggiatoa alba B18LD]|uniref:Uncharacterized protein n=1 Tax=Beggiatoa alba B18LD TaxID=395493 RepID=I3CK58_9GAMM|nr:hypothetical protein [Beggiatoa alba]EIJ44001.1 hypothetical protein BegalDRAFT_3177 [Beggiatoa alba B18LD]
MMTLSNTATELCRHLQTTPEALKEQGLLKQVGIGFLIATHKGRETLKQLDPTHTSVFDLTCTSDPTTKHTRTSDPDTTLTEPEKVLLMDLILTDNSIQDLLDMGLLVEDSEGRLIPNEG